MPKTLVTVAPVWTANAPSNPFEFSFDLGADHFDALRHRTDFGWSWFEIFRNGKLFRSGGGLTDPLVLGWTEAL